MHEPLASTSPPQLGVAAQYSMQGPRQVAQLVSPAAQVLTYWPLHASQLHWQVQVVVRPLLVPPVGRVPPEETMPMPPVVRRPPDENPPVGSTWTPPDG